MNCIHGINKLYCHYCNGNYNKENIVKKKIQKEDNEMIEIKREYETSKITFKNFFEPWTEDEYQILYDNLNSVGSVRSKRFRKVIYILAIELQRSRRAIMWKYKYMFILKTNPKAGKELLEFVKNKKV